jgi:hypothetical protein
VLRLRSRDPTVAFAASIDDLLATTMEPLQDVDTALLAGVDRQFQVSIEGTLTDVSAIVDLPENPGERTPPYILITPWSVQAVGKRGGSGEIIGNYTTTGAFVRPAPQEIQLEYRIDVLAQVRSHNTLVMGHILGDFGARLRLVVNGEPLEMTPFAPSDTLNFIATQKLLEADPIEETLTFNANLEFSYLPVTGLPLEIPRDGVGGEITFELTVLHATPVVNEVLGTSTGEAS